MSSPISPGMIGWVGKSCEASQLTQSTQLCLQALMVSPLVCAKERQQNEALERKVKHLLLMDEDEYDALPEEKKAEMDRILLERKKIRRER